MNYVRCLSVAAFGALSFTTACAQVDVADGRTVQIPSPATADQRTPALNERPDSVMYLPLGEDILVPELAEGEPFPKEQVGPFELRGETVAGALQLILAEHDVSIAFETQEGLTRRVTVANLRGELGQVINQVCSLANLYCSYEHGGIIVKDRQTFTVALPPLGGAEGSTFFQDVTAGLTAILNSGETGAPAPIVDTSTRTIVYSATQRTADMAARYFQRLRANTAMIVFETYIWEVSLNAGNAMGIDWFKLGSFGKFKTGIRIDGDIGTDFTSPISIGLPTVSGSFDGTSGDIVQFLSQFGAVKTISQPQITVLSGSQAELRVADTQNYVSQIATTLSEGQATTSVNTDSVDSGFTLSIGSSWDKSTVYANIEMELTNVKQIDDFAFADNVNSGDPNAGGQTRIQLPQTTERQVTTQIRVRPGDSVLIAGLVRENDNFSKRGLGLMEPIIPDSRTAQTENLELVVLLRPRVIVYTAANDKRYIDYAMKKHTAPGTGVQHSSAMELSEPARYGNVYKPVSIDAATSLQDEIPSGIPAALTPEPFADRPSATEPVAIIRPMTETTPQPSAQPSSRPSTPRISPLVNETPRAPEAAPRPLLQPSPQPRLPRVPAPEPAPRAIAPPAYVAPVAPVTSIVPAAPVVPAAAAKAPAQAPVSSVPPKLREVRDILAELPMIDEPATASPLTAPPPSPGQSERMISGQINGDAGAAGSGPSIRRSEGFSSSGFIRSNGSAGTAAR
ncbi:MAG: type II and III secretion system family protein [Micavibrio sp.]